MQGVVTEFDDDKGFGTVRAAGDGGPDYFFHCTAIADDPAKGREALQKEGLYASIEDCLTVDMADQPGSLGDICSRLSGAGINIDYAYTGITQTPGKAIVVMVVSDLDKAAKIVG